MSAAVALVPSAPLLLPEYTGREDVGAPLRARAVEVVRAVAGGSPGGVVLVVASDREQRGGRSPLGQRVGEHLAALAGVPVHAVVVVPWDLPTVDCRSLGTRLAGEADGRALVVVADGSARRGEKAPGHLDERAFAVDDAIAAAVGRGALPELLDLDPVLCAELLVHGRAPLQVAAAVSGDADLVCADLEVSDPFGVRYLVARLAGRGAGDPPA